MPDHPDTVPKLAAAALAAFGDEHGLPNAISPKELHEVYSGPYPLDFGWHYRYNRADLDAHCALQGVRITKFEKPSTRDFKRIEIDAA